MLLSLFGAKSIAALLVVQFGIGAVVRKRSLQDRE